MQAEGGANRTGSSPNRHLKARRVVYFYFGGDDQGWSSFTSALTPFNLAALHCPCAFVGAYPGGLHAAYNDHYCNFCQNLHRKAACGQAGVNKIPQIAAFCSAATRPVMPCLWTSFIEAL